MSSDTSPNDPTSDIPAYRLNPFTKGTPLYGLYRDRVKNQQDIVIILDDYHVRRGTGKTICSLQLAAGMDRTPEGITTEKVALEPEAIREAYAEQPKGSALVMDEAEVGASNRQAMSNVNQALREIMSMARVQEKYVILNAPSAGFMDKSIRALASAWMTVTAKGTAILHWIQNNPYSGQQLTPKKQIFRWKDIDKNSQLRDVYNYLTREKLKRIGGEEGDGFIPRKEHQQILEKAKTNVRKDERNDIMKKLHEHPDIDISYAKIGDCVGLTGQRVGQIVRDMDD